MSINDNMKDFIHLLGKYDTLRSSVIREFKKLYEKYELEFVLNEELVEYMRKYPHINNLIKYYTSHDLDNKNLLDIICKREYNKGYKKGYSDGYSNDYNCWSNSNNDSEDAYEEGYEAGYTEACKNRGFPEIRDDDNAEERYGLWD